MLSSYSRTVPGIGIEIAAVVGVVVVGVIGREGWRDRSVGKVILGLIVKARSSRASIRARARARDSMCKLRVVEAGRMFPTGSSRLRHGPLLCEAAIASRLKSPTTDHRPGTTRGGRVEYRGSRLKKLEDSGSQAAVRTGQCRIRQGTWAAGRVVRAPVWDLGSRSSASRNTKVRSVPSEKHSESDLM